MWAQEGTPSDIVEDGITSEWSLSPLSTNEIQMMFSTGGSWLDDPDPSEEFTALTVSDINDMWD